MLYVRIHEISDGNTVLTDTDTGLSKRMSDDAAIDLFLKRNDIYGISFVEDKKGGYFKIKGKQKEMEQKYKTDATFRANCGNILKLELVDSVKEKQAQIRQMKKIQAMKQTISDMDNITSGLSFLDSNTPTEDTLPAGYHKMSQTDKIKYHLNEMDKIQRNGMADLEKKQKTNNQRMTHMMANTMAAKRVIYQGQEALGKIAH